jgi:hypothetical protein
LFFRLISSPVLTFLTFHRKSKEETERVAKILYCIIKRHYYLDPLKFLLKGHFLRYGHLCLICFSCFCERVLNSGEGHQLMSVPESSDSKFVAALSALGKEIRQNMSFPRHFRSCYMRKSVKSMIFPPFFPPCVLLLEFLCLYKSGVSAVCTQLPFSQIRSGLSLSSLVIPSSNSSLAVLIVPQEIKSLRSGGNIMYYTIAERSTWNFAL